MRIFLKFCKNDVEEKAKVVRYLVFVLFLVNDGTSKLRSHKFVHVYNFAAILQRWEGAKGLDRTSTCQIP